MATANNKKPAPAARPNLKAVKAPPAPAQAKDIDDDIDTDDVGGDEGEGTSFHKLPPAKRVAVRLGNEVNRLTKQFDTVNRWPDNGSGAVEKAKEALLYALGSLKGACEALTSLPDDYRPRVAKAGKTGGGKAELKAGDRVRITDKRVEEYTGLLEPEMMRGIEVIEIRGSKVICKTADGLRAMFARGHVCLDDATPAKASA